MQFHRLLIRISQAHQKRSQARFSELGLSPGQPKTIVFLKSMDGCIQKELASACGIEPATLSEILNRMEKRNLISRQESVTAGGKHAMRVHLTQEGLDLYADVDAIVKDVEKLSFKGFSKAERQQFMSFFERIYLNLGVN